MTYCAVIRNEVSVDWAQQSMSKYRKVETEKVCHGVSETEAIGICHSEENFKRGLAKRDIIEKDGLFYFKRKTVTATDGRENRETVGLLNDGVDQDHAEDMINTMLEDCDWKAFSNELVLYENKYSHEKNKILRV